LLCRLLSSTTVAAKDKWISLSTRNFNIISNTQRECDSQASVEARAVSLRVLKDFQSARERPTKTTVMVFRNESSFDPYKPLNGKPANVAGYFQGGEDENLIVMDISAQYPLACHSLTAADKIPSRWPNKSEIGSCEYVNRSRERPNAPAEEPKT
jgi:hypothetical protein